MDKDIMTTEEELAITESYETYVNIPVSKLRDAIEQEIDKYRLKEHFPSYNQCTVFKSSKIDAHKYLMVLYMYDAALDRTFLRPDDSAKLVKDPTSWAPCNKQSWGQIDLCYMKYNEHITISVDVQGDQISKITSKFNASGNLNTKDLQGHGVCYSTLIPIPYVNFTNTADGDPVAIALQEAAHSRFGLVIRKKTNPLVCNGNPYFIYYKDQHTVDHWKSNEWYKKIQEETGHPPNRFVFTGVYYYREQMDRPTTRFHHFTFGVGFARKHDGTWKRVSSGIHTIPTTYEGPNAMCYTNHEAAAHNLNLITDEWHIQAKYTPKPYDINDPGITDKDCKGESVDPDDLPQPPSGNTGLPTGHKYFLKATEGSIPTCWTFDGFQHRDGHWNINASNGRILKYIHDGGCWHFFTSLAASTEIKSVLKDVTTNNKDLHDFFMKNKGKHTGKLIHYSQEVNISKDYWLNSKNLYFASWTSKEKTDKPQDQTFYLALFDFADGNTIRKPGGVTTTPIVAHFENGKIVKLSSPWKDYKTEWKPEGTYDEYRFDKLPKYNNFKTNHRVLWGWLERHGRIAGSQSKFISPCTQIKPDGTLPDGVQGPNLPPTVKPPGGNNDGYDPNKPGQGSNGLGDNGPIRYEDIGQCYAGLDNLTMLTNNKLNGLYYYYLEGSLYNAGGSDNTTILGTTGAICNVAYAPFLNLNASNLCRAEFDTKRYGKIEGIEAENLQPKVFRIKADFSPKPMKIAQWPVYPSVNINTGVGTPWKYYHESRILDYPYRQVAFISNVFDAYDVIPHLFSETNKGNNVELNICCPVTPGGNFYAWVEGYKGDSSGFNERQFSNASMDIPNTSSAYSNYMSTQKAQASTSVFSSFGSSLISSAPGIVATASQSSSELIKWANMGWSGAGSTASIMAGAMAFPLGIAAASAVAAGASAVMQNMALQKDLRTTPKSLISMGGDINARLGCDGNATVVACDYEITDQYKELIARYFHMYGTKQNRILDIASNINSRHYFNYIKTVGCNISANGVPKRYVAAIKSIFDKGATFWHVDNSGVNVGEYCVYDNVEV